MHNFLKKSLDMKRRGELPDVAGILDVTYAHDGWCNFLSGKGECNCDPTCTINGQLTVIDGKVRLLPVAPRGQRS